MENPTVCDLDPCYEEVNKFRHVSEFELCCWRSKEAGTSICVSMQPKTSFRAQFSYTYRSFGSQVVDWSVIWCFVYSEIFFKKIAFSDNPFRGSRVEIFRHIYSQLELETAQLSPASSSPHRGSQNGMWWSRCCSSNRTQKGLFLEKVDFLRQCVLKFCKFYRWTMRNSHGSNRVSLVKSSTWPTVTRSGLLTSASQ